MTDAPPPLPPGAAPEPENEVKLSFLDHLRELRVRLIHALLGIFVGLIAVGVFSKTIFDELMKPVVASLPEGQRLPTALAPHEALVVYFKVAMYGGVFVAMPWVLWQLWLFIAPGLYKKEKRVVIPFLFWGTLLFYSGAAFCFFVVMPLAFPAMYAIAEGSANQIVAMTPTLSLVLAMLLGFGVIFEVPVIIAFLSIVGLVNASFLAKYRRHAIIVNVAAAAVLTPTGDPLNLALMALPMVLFYEIGILLARILGKKKKQPEEALTSA
jgi:sec-independent protein translocase protein TatC